MSIFKGLTPLTPPQGARREKRSSIFEGLTPLNEENGSSFAQEGDAEGNDEQEEQLVQNFKSLPPEEQSSLMDDILRWGAREVLKPAAQGITGVVDLPASLYNLASMGINYAADTNLPQAPYLSDAVGKGVDYVTQGYSEGEPGIFGKGVEFATGMATGGGIAKHAIKHTGAKTGSKALQKGSQLLGSTEPAAIGGAAVTGSTIKGLEESGMDPLSSIGGGIGAGIAAQAVGTALSKKPILRAAGLGPKDLKVEALNAAESQGLDLPNWAASEAKSMKLASQLASHTPFVGDKMQKQAQTFGEAFLEKIKQTAEKIGPERDTKVIDALYDRSRKFLPQDAVIQPNHVLDALTDIEQQIRRKGIKSSKTKEVLRDIADYKKILNIGEFEELKFIPPTPVENLVETKQELNAIIDWDKKTDLPTKYYKDIREALVKDIEDYGKENPQFLKAFNKANQHRQKVGRREAFDQKFEGKLGEAKEGVKYASFINLATDPKKRRALQKIIGNENLKDFGDLVTTAKAMKAAFNVPNPSATGPIKTLYEAGKKIISLLATGAIFQIEPTAGAAAVGIPLYVKRLLTNPKILKQAKAFAEKPSETYLKRLNKLVQADVGISLEQLAKEMEKGTA